MLVMREPTSDPEPLCGTHNLVLDMGNLFALLKEGYDGCKHKVGEVWIGSCGPIFHSASQSSNHFIRILVRTWGRSTIESVSALWIFLCFEMVFESSGARVTRTRRGGWSDMSWAAYISISISPTYHFFRRGNGT